MKTLFVFVILAIAVHSIQCDDLSSAKNEFENQKKICKRSHPVPRDIMQKLLNRELIEDEKLKAYIFCLAVMRKFVKENGSYNGQLMKNKYSTFAGNHGNDKIFDQCTKHPIIGDGIASYWKFIRCFQLKSTGDSFYTMIRYYWY